MKMMWNWI